ncbi:MAG: hypothetical protein KC518_08450 [Candidatus Cloacimonetes bacterium]|nr:hypothetical protein [Candidatus Cloacimonadota bacterium]
MTRALLITHGDLAQGLLSAATQIVGPITDVDCLSNRGLSRDELVLRIGEWLDRDEDPVLLLVDFPGSSCHISSSIALRTRPGRAPLLCGVNLMMLVGLVNKRHELSGDELSQACLESARRSLQCKETSA